MQTEQLPTMQVTEPVSQVIKETNILGNDFIIRGVRLANAAFSNEAMDFKYPETVFVAANKLQTILEALKIAGNQLLENQKGGGGRKAEKQFIQHCHEMEKLCNKILKDGESNAEEVDNTARELWNLIKTTPPIMAAAMGYTKEQLVSPQLRGGDNPYISVLGELAEIRDEIDKEMKFKPKTREVTHVESRNKSGVKCYLPLKDFLILNGVLYSVCTASLCAFIYTRETANIASLLAMITTVLSGALALVLTIGTISDEKFKISEEVPEPDHLKEYLKLANELKEKSLSK